MTVYDENFREKHLKNKPETNAVIIFDNCAVAGIIIMEHNGRSERMT